MVQASRDNLHGDKARLEERLRVCEKESAEAQSSLEVSIRNI